MNLRLLIIHECAQADHYESLLERSGLDIAVANSFDEADALVETVSPDMIILPTKLDGRDGRLYSLNVRALMEDQSPTLILLDSSNDISEWINAYRYGVNDVVPSQIKDDEFVIRILVHLHRRLEAAGSRGK